MPLSLLEIHTALATAPRSPQSLGDKPDHSHRTLQAVKQGQDSSVFHETLHEYSLFARPANAADISSLFQLVRRLIELCGTSNDCWKVFALTVLLRRYHEKAPEAKKESDEGAGQGSAGDGERLLFYGTLLELQSFWHEKLGLEEGRLAYEAAAATIRIAAEIGGTRDLSHIIEHLTFTNLKRAGVVSVGEDTAPASFADVLVTAVDAIFKDSPPDDLLELAVSLAARYLDQDLALLGSKHSEDDEGEWFISTIHVMIPHNQRGSNTKMAWKRKLANSVAEILIWQRTDTALKDERFARALSRFKTMPAGSPTEHSHKLILQMQTTARKQRQLLNGHARRQGFLLTSSYQMDKTSLTLSQIRRAKVGDLKRLEKLARKNADGFVVARSF